MRRFVLPLVLGLAVNANAADLTRADAEKRALADVPGGKVVEAERETENGRNVWSLDVRSADGKHVFEVQYEVSTGKLVSKKEESRREQAREAKADAAAGAAAAASSAAPPPAYAVVSRLAVGGEGGWDYLVADATTKRLYVPRSTRVAVLDLGTGKAVGEIPKTEGVHGVALAHDLGRGFTSNGRAGTVTIFELDTLKVISEVKATGENPDAILYEPSTKRVFSFNGRGKNATAFDAATGAVAGTIALGGKPEFAQADGAGRVFVNVEDTSEVAVLDAKALAVVSRWKVAGCEEPSGLALDAKGKRLFLACGNEVAAVVSTVDGKLLAKVPTGAGSDGAAFDAGAGLAFVSSGEGTLTVIREEAPGSYTGTKVPTERGARTVALDERSHRLYLPTASFGPPPSPTAERPHPRPAAVPGSFHVVVVAPKG